VTSRTIRATCSENLARILLIFDGVVEQGCDDGLLISTTGGDQFGDFE
jgi:hypothetical protein